MATAIVLSVDTLMREHRNSVTVLEAGITKLVDAAADLEMADETQQIHELEESLKKALHALRRQEAELQVLASLKRSLENGDNVVTLLLFLRLDHVASLGTAPPDPP